MPGGKFARANRAKREQKAAAAAAGATDAAPAQTQNRRKKPQPKKKDPWAAALAKARQAVGPSSSISALNVREELSAEKKKERGSTLPPLSEYLGVTRTSQLTLHTHNFTLRLHTSTTQTQRCTNTIRTKIYIWNRNVAKI